MYVGGLQLAGSVLQEIALVVDFFARVAFRFFGVAAGAAGCGRVTGLEGPLRRLLVRTTGIFSV